MGNEASQKARAMPAQPTPVDPDATRAAILALAQPGQSDLDAFARALAQTPRFVEDVLGARGVLFYTAIFNAGCHDPSMLVRLLGANAAEGSTCATAKELSTRCEKEFPSLANELHALFAGFPTPGLTSFRAVASSSDALLTPDQRYVLSLTTCCTLGIPGELLFSTSVEGRSFEKLAARISGYSGPILFVVLDKQGNVFGFVSSDVWRDTNQMVGSRPGELFGIDSSGAVVVRRPTFRDHNAVYQYLNTHGNTTFLKRGIGFGGSTDAFRVWVDDDFSECVCAEMDAQFEPGAIRFNKTDSSFEVAQLDAYGVGTEAALEDRDASDKANRDLIQQRRKVDKSKFANNEFDREFMLGKTFKSSGERRDA